MKWFTPNRRRGWSRPSSTRRFNARWLGVRLDELLAHYNETLPRLEEFILPGGSRPAALAHVARTVARRAERAIVALGRDESVRPVCRQYVNRLSDLMFVLARVLNRAGGQPDVLWQQGRNG